MADENEKAVTTVVIDPGHGGHDQGCSGSNSFEKHIVLDIALQLGDYINENYPNVDVIYTRKKDKFVPLHKRSEIANKNSADVFISLHANATATSSVKGTETFVMGLHRTKQNLKVAKRENAVVTMEDNYKENYDGFDPNSPQGHIIFSLHQNAHLEQSINLASKIEHQFKERANRKSRGVKQAGFLVLYKTTMPSVLIETGFLTNKQDERYLKSDRGKTYTASAIYRAFRNYKKEIDKKIMASKDNKDDQGDNTTHATASTKKKVGASSANVDNTASSSANQKQENKKQANKNIIFGVQLMASEKKIDTDNSKFKSIENLWIDETKEGAFKYLAGRFTNYDKALTHQGQLREKGFKGAWVVSYQNGKRIPLKEAIAELNQDE